MPSATPKPPHVVLGVAGGIAAYKSVELLRRLRERGYVVSPVLTREATAFVGPLTFSALASEPARVELFSDPTTPIPHTYLGQRADVVVVAPATAHLIARYANGLADDLLSATLLATQAPVLLCPAMHTEMWEQPSVQANVATLAARGVLFLGPASGPLAGGDDGPGRVCEPEEIAATVAAIVDGYHGPLTGRRVLVSAGGTREAIDPVRVIANRSSGRQGYALAEVAARMGASVTLVSAADRPLAPDVARRVAVETVESAEEMRVALAAHAAPSDVIVMAAAVADFAPERSPDKLKRRDGIPEIRLHPTPDILAALVADRRPGQVVVGFAAETADATARGAAKLADKGVDLLVVNDVTVAGAGFEHATNEVTLLEPGVEPEVVSLRSKEAVAQAVLSRVARILESGES